MDYTQGAGIACAPVSIELSPPSVDMETKRVLRRCISATRALAELKGAGEIISNQAILINTIPLQEAQD